jgi:glutathione reductase (NADPH)
MSQYDYDLVVIGGGSGGVRTARMASAMGARVAIIEDLYWGGTCVNVGCVPKKLYYYASHFSESFEDSRGFGWQLGDITFDWELLKSNRRTEISRLNGIYQNILGSAEVEIIDGHGAILDPHTVDIDGQRQLSTKNILIATGAWPFVPEFPGREHVITSNEVFDLPELPKTMVIVGGGYIAIEFAGIFNGLGVETHQIYRGDKLLRHFDQSVREVITEEVARKGVKLSLNVNVESVEKDAQGLLQVKLSNGQQIEAGVVLYATGRTPNFRNLGLENVAVELTEKGIVKVDDFYQSTVPSIYALGDIIHSQELTPVALAEGMVLAKHLFGGGCEPLDYDYIPTAVFSQPNIASVGLTEEKALKTCAELSVFESSFKHMKNTLSGNEARTYMKLLVDKGSDKVVGIHMVGEDAGEIMQGLAVAMKAGVTKAQLDSTIGIHPTAAEEFVTMREPAR